jgi:hypothetical protein
MIVWVARDAIVVSNRIEDLSRRMLKLCLVDIVGTLEVALFKNRSNLPRYGIRSHCSDTKCNAEVTDFREAYRELVTHPL